MCVGAEGLCFSSIHPSSYTSFILPTDNNKKQHRVSTSIKDCIKSGTTNANQLSISGIDSCPISPPLMMSIKCLLSYKLSAHRYM